jgi:hypothetical protein
MWAALYEICSLQVLEGLPGMMYACISKCIKTPLLVGQIEDIVKEVQPSKEIFIRPTHPGAILDSSNDAAVHTQSDPPETP